VSDRRQPFTQTLIMFVQATAQGLLVHPPVEGLPQALYSRPGRSKLFRHPSSYSDGRSRPRGLLVSDRVPEGGWFLNGLPTPIWYAAG